MNDSSERDYELLLTDIDDFGTWCDRTVNTGNTLYVFNKTYNVGENQHNYLLIFRLADLIKRNFSFIG
jgi:hypothetical protein